MHGDSALLYKFCATFVLCCNSENACSVLSPTFIVNRVTTCSVPTIKLIIITTINLMEMMNDKNIYKCFIVTVMWLFQ